MNTTRQEFESVLHAELGMSDSEIRREMQEQGLNPDNEVAALRAMVSNLVATRAPAAQISINRILAGNKRFPIYEESVAAGIPAPACDGQTDSANISELLSASNPDSVIWAKVSGDSMRDVGILDGDYILFDSKIEARDGDIVLAHLAGEGQVVKTLRLPVSGGAILESANPDFAPILVSDASMLRIHGVVTARAGRL